jgi:hypothetical protein
MDVVGDFGQYITHIDWLGGLIAASLAVIVVVLAVRVAGRASDGSVGLGGWLAARTLAGLLALRSDVPDTPWICATCRSVNPPSVSRCYRGCGRRADIELPRSVDEPSPDHPGRRRGGRTARRR